MSHASVKSDLALGGKPWPRITVVTPSFNQAAFLEDAIRSVLGQGYPNLQYIIVDGGSTDGSVDIIRRYESALSWWCSERDAGQPNAINKGFARGDGELLTFINSDDMLNPGSLRRAAEEFLAGHEWIVSPCRCIAEGRRDTYFRTRPRISKLRWFLANPIPQPGTFWAAKWFARGVREDLRYMFDYELWMRLRFWMDLRPRVIEQSLGTYREQPDSATSRKGAEFTREFLRIHAEYQSALSPWQRWCAVVMLVLLLPVGRAVQQHLAAFAAVGDGRRAAALGHLACSVLWFPPALFHLRTWSVLRACLRGPHPRPRPAVAPSAVEGGFVN